MIYITKAMIGFTKNHTNTFLIEIFPSPLLSSPQRYQAMNFNEGFAKQYLISAFLSAFLPSLT